MPDISSDRSPFLSAEYMAMSHAQIWSAIDALAERNALSASALARQAGLDSTAFNRSKRFSSDGRPRWPTTESLVKVLAATGESFDGFAVLYDSSLETKGLRAESLGPVVPLLGFAQAGDGGFFDDAGFPSGHGWDAIQLPELDDEQCYALEVSGDSMLPLYRDGDIIVVSPGAQIRRHDRVVVRTRSGEVLAKMLQRRTNDHVELHSLNADHPDRKIPLSDVDWIARIVWASQ
ncbi:MAG: helix-turn-helix transcriptional regulator [Hyphomicrobiales bacterium]